MIKLHRLDGLEVVINAELIETIVSVPDTKITLTAGNQFIVKESVDCVIEKVREYRQSIQLEKQSDQEKLINKKEPSPSPLPKGED